MKRKSDYLANTLRLKTINSRTEQRAKNIDKRFLHVIPCLSSEDTSNLKKIIERFSGRIKAALTREETNQGKLAICFVKSGIRVQGRFYTNRWDWQMTDYGKVFPELSNKPDYFHKALFLAIMKLWLNQQIFENDTANLIVEMD